MAPALFLSVAVLLTCSVVDAGPSSSRETDDATLRRESFPKGFVFGCSTAAYQIEGAVAEGGRGPSIWDTFTHDHPERVLDGSNGDTATDSYHRYKEDVNRLKDMNMDAYRFSISWSRILPNGSLSGGISREGVQYYNDLIDYLLSRGLQPFVTLFHFDTPQALEDSYGSFLNRSIVADFRDYADVCFRKFGDRVKHWITFNEPHAFCSASYADGRSPPGRCSPFVDETCFGGDSAREPYTVGHNLLLAHAAAAKLYKDKYQLRQGGLVGITLDSVWFVPLGGKANMSDVQAVHRALDFSFGWFMEPLTYGDYPSTMSRLVGNRLPKFTKKESDAIKVSIDFLGLNYYTSNYATARPFSNQINASYLSDSRVTTTAFRNGEPIGPKAASPWLFVYPLGFKEMLLYIKTSYNNPVIYVTENGVNEANNDTMPLEEALDDDLRISYHRQHLMRLQEAIREGVDVRGYFAWSLLDNFEWINGYTLRFGLNYVDYNDGLRRYPKKSALWFKELLERFND